MARLCLNGLACVFMYLLSACASTGIPAGRTGQVNEPVSGAPANVFALPPVASLDANYHRTTSDLDQMVPGWPGAGNHSDNATQVLPDNSVRLESSAAEFSYALYGLHPGDYAEDVPYIAPYEIDIHTTNTDPFWVAMPDYHAGRWSFKGPFTPGSSPDSITLSVGLRANASSVLGNFWICILSCDGSAPEISHLQLKWPDVPAPSANINYHEFIEMEDGTMLATDIYLPYRETNDLIPDPPYPVLLLRTALDKADIDDWIIPTLVPANVVVMVQYFRGRLDDEPTGGWPDVWPYSWPDSTGTESMFRDHAGPDNWDVLDTVDWIESRQWYNGDLVLSGSYIDSNWIYQSAPKLGARVKAMFPYGASGNLADQFFMRNGCFRRGNALTYTSLNHYPLESFPDLVDNYGNDEYWTWYDVDDEAYKVKCPGYHETGWFDLNVDATINTWRELQYNGGEGAQGNQWLVIGPGRSGIFRQNYCGQIDFPETGDIHDPRVLPVRWRGEVWSIDQLGRFLGVFIEPENHIYAYFIGSPGRTTEPHNTWYELPTWPPPYEEYTLFLDASEPSYLWLDPFIGIADTTVTVEVDPDDPVPTQGGANLSGLYHLAGMYNQTTSRDHEDVILFYSDDFSSTLPMAGPVNVVLYVSTDAADTDVMVKLLANDGLGQYLLVTDSAVRLSAYLEDHGLGEVVPGQVYELEFTIGQVGFIQGQWYETVLAVQGTNYPRFDINPGTGEDFYSGEGGVPYHLTVHTGPSYPSRLIIPEYDPRDGGS